MTHQFITIIIILGLSLLEVISLVIVAVVVLLLLLENNSGEKYICPSTVARQGKASLFV